MCSSLGVDEDELFGIAFYGLSVAMQIFDPSLGYSFSTLAARVLHTRMSRLIRDGKRRHIHADSIHAVAYASSDGDDVELLDMIPSKEDFVADTHNRMLMADVKEFLSTIKIRDAYIVKMYYEDDMSQKEIAATFNITQVQVSRILKNTLEKCRPVVEA
jgi:RNA polymerase sigma factor (sigma-70 family)